MVWSQKGVPKIQFLMTYTTQGARHWVKRLSYLAVVACQRENSGFHKLLRLSQELDYSGCHLVELKTYLYHSPFVIASSY